MALTLNQTPSTDNEAIFLLRIAAEGNNLISNSTFTVDETWTKGGDWAIGSGVATYTYVDDATGNLDIAIEAAEAVEYILEYRVTAVSAGTFDIYLRGGAGLFAPATIILDKTLGKHSITFTGQASETTFGIGASGFSAAESISIDDVKVRKREDPIFISTRDITLSPNTFDGQILSWNQLSDLASFADAEIGGGIGAVTSFNFSISRHTSNSRTSSFFNEFFPAYDGGMVIARDVQFGIVWDTGTPDYTNVTWLMKGRVINYQIEPRKINLVVLQETEFDAKELPYYSIQKDFDNAVSYFEDAPEENYGSVLPLVYGDFSLYNDDQLLFKPRLFPIVCVDKYKLRYVCASHKFDSELFSTGGGTASFMHQYIDGVDTYMGMSCDNGSAINNDIIAYVTNYDTLNSTDNVIIGTINVHPVLPGARNDKTNFADAIDDDNSTNVVSTYSGGYDELVVKLKGGGSPPGVLSRSANSIELKAYIIDASVGTLQIGMSYINPEYNSGVGGDGTGNTFTYTTGVELKTYDMSSDFAGRDVSDEPWRWDDLMGLEYVIRAQEGHNITIRDLWLRITNIIVNDPRLSRPRAKTPRDYGTRNRGGR